MVIGSPGAGKSTFSRRLGEMLDMEVIHLDKEHWRPGWMEPTDDEWERIVKGLVARDRWIIDGNYGGSTMDLRLERADTVVFLDFPRVVCLWRVMKRRWMYRGRTRPDMAPGCPEKLDWGLIRFIWGYRKKSRPSVLQKLERHSGKKVYILRYPWHAQALLHNCSQTIGREGL